MESLNSLEGLTSHKLWKGTLPRNCFSIIYSPNEDQAANLRGMIQENEIFNDSKKLVLVSIESSRRISSQKKNTPMRPRMLPRITGKRDAPEPRHLKAEERIDNEAMVQGKIHVVIGGLARPDLTQRLRIPPNQPQAPCSTRESLKDLLLLKTANRPRSSSFCSRLRKMKMPRKAPLFQNGKLPEL